MVEGLEIFKTHFAKYKDRYVLIGGTASSLAMAELGEEFRATKDLDIVLIIEALDAEFAAAFWDFVKAGDYEHCHKGSGRRIFYRFTSPKTRGYPFMLELFSRVPDALEIAPHSELTPLPVGEEASSLSAILMDEDYYAFVHKHRREMDGLSSLGAEALIPLKARAFTDLSHRAANGEHVDSKNIKKHRNDIFRLYTILDLSTPCELSPAMKLHLIESFDQISKETVDLKAMKIRSKSQQDILDELGDYYALK